MLTISTAMGFITASVGTLSGTGVGQTINLVLQSIFGL